MISLGDKEIYQIAAGPFHTLMLDENGDIYAMGSTKDGKLGFSVQGSSSCDIELPMKIPNCPVFYKKRVAKTVIKQYPLFDDYDGFCKLKSVCDKQVFFEVNQIVCGDAFQLFLTNHGQLYSCGSNKYGMLGICDDEASDSSDGGDDSDEGGDGDDGDGGDDDPEEEKRQEKTEYDDDMSENDGMDRKVKNRYQQLLKRQDKWVP